MNCEDIESIWKQAVADFNKNIVIEDREILYALSKYDINNNKVLDLATVKPNLVNKRGWIVTGDINSVSLMSKFDNDTKEIHWYKYDTSGHTFSSWRAYNMILAEVGFITI